MDTVFFRKVDQGDRGGRSFVGGTHSKVALFLSLHTLKGCLYDSYISSIEAKFNFISSFFKVLIKNSLTKWETNCCLRLYWAYLYWSETDKFIAGDHILLSYHYIITIKVSI